MKIKPFDNMFYSGFLMGIGLMLVFSFVDNYFISVGISMMIIGVVGTILKYLSNRNEVKENSR